MRKKTAVAAALTVGAGLGAYALYEPYRFRLTTHAPEMPARSPRLTILHLSDLHMRSSSNRLVAWLERLVDALATTPDLVVATGDLIENDDGIDLAVTALNGFEARHGRFYVLGSHDYYRPKFDARSTLLKRGSLPSGARRAEVTRLESGLTDKGWVSVANRTEFLEVAGRRIRISGVDDPFLNRHRTDHIERTADDALAIGLAHSPDVVSEYALAGFDLVLAGHTHAGQVRLPAIGAVVTNCSLPAGLAGGLHRVGATWLHVSPGLGHGTFTPIRFGARPEATLLRLEPRSS